jgi:hypothetical protein
MAVLIAKDLPSGKLPILYLPFIPQ